MVFFGAALPAAYCCLEVGPLGPADGAAERANFEATVRGREAQSIREPRRSATARIAATDQANAARLASARASRRFGCARVDATDRVDAGAVGSTRAPNRSDTTRINTSASYQHDTARINASAESFRGASR